MGGIASRTPDSTCSAANRAGHSHIAGIAGRIKLDEAWSLPEFEDIFDYWASVLFTRRSEIFHRS